MGIALSAVLTDLVVRHVKLIGGDAEQAVRTTRDALNESLSSLQTTGTTLDGEQHDESNNIKTRVGKMLDFVETNARNKLKLPPLPSKRH
jgi:ABC-type transporter Mla subunit MlaD